MAITRTPTPVDVTTSTTAVPMSQIDRAPAPVDIPTVTQTVPRSQVDRAPATVSTSSDPGLSPTTTTVSRPLTTLTSSGNASANTATSSLITVETNTVTNVTVPNPLYLTVSDEGTVVLSRTTSINFLGSGVAVTNTDGTATVSISGGGNADLGNWAFTSNTQYNLNGGTINNSDLSHGATASLTIPANGNTSAMSLLNYYGNISLTAAANPSSTKTWTFNSSGNIVLPSNTSSINYANGSPYGGGGANLGNLSIDDNNIYNTNGQGVVVSNFSFIAEAETAYVQIPAGNSPSDLSVVQEQGNVRLAANAATWTFNTDSSFKLPNNANIKIVDNTITQINSVATANGAINLRTFDANGNVGASTFFDGGAGTLDFYSFNYTTDNSYNWRFDNGGSFTLPNAPGNVYFGEDASQPVIIPIGTGFVFNANRADTAQDYITVSQDGLELFSVHPITIDNSTTGLLGTDIVITSGDDIRLGGRNKPNDSESEGGDINIVAGQGSNAVTGGNDTGGGGDIQIYAGAGGLAQVTTIFGGSGGTIDISAGDGGTSLDSLVGSGGWISLTAGSAATPTTPADTANGGFGGTVSITAGATTRINEPGGSISLNTGAGSGDGYGPAGSVDINIATSNVGSGGTWTFVGTGTTLNVPANSEIYGANFGNFTVGCAGNTIVTSSDYGANVKNWVFGYTGNLLAPGNIITPTNFVGTSLRTNLSNFNWSASITNITTGATTVVTLANNIFGDPWDGQVTITDVGGATEANATWWYSAVDSNAFQLYTDNTFTTPVDSSTWGSYTGGGFAVTINYGNIQINAQTVTIQSGQADYNNRAWSFNSNGQTIFPYLNVARGDVGGGNITGYAMVIGDGANEAIISTPDGSATTGPSSQRLVINPGKGQNGTSGEGGDIYLWAGRGGDTNGNGGDVKVRGGYGPGNGQGGYIRMEGGEVQGTGAAGFIELLGGTAGGAAGGYISLTGGPGATVGGNISIQGGYGSGDAGGAVVIQGGGSGQGLASYGNVGVVAGSSSWAFDNTGTLTFPSLANISGGNFNAGTASAIAAVNAFSPDGNTVSFQARGNSSTAVIQAYNNTSTTTQSWTFDNTGNLTVPGTIIGAQANVDLVSGIYTWTMDNTGVLKVPGEIHATGNLILETTSGVPSGVNTITGSSGSWESNPQSNLATTGGTGTGLTVDVTETGGYASTITVHTAGTGYTNGDSITVTSGSSNATFTIDVPIYNWNFGKDSTLIVPGEGIIQSLNDTVILQSKNTGTGNTYSARLGTTGGLYFETTEYPLGWLSITNNVGNANITAATGTAGAGGKNLYITAGSADQGDFYTTPGGSINITGGLGASNDGGGGGPGGNVNITAGLSADPSGVAGNVNITSGTKTWNFDNTGNLSFPSAGAFMQNVRTVTGGAVPSGFYPTYYNPTTKEFIVVTP